MIDSTNPRILADNIRALQAAVETLGAYSTEETNTGKKWIDDSTIYKKVFFVESLPNATTKSINHGITNLKNVIKLEGLCQAAEGASGFPFPYATTLLLRYTSTQIAIQASGNSSSQSAYIIMEYTKSATPSNLVSPSPDGTRSIEPVIREGESEVEPIIDEPIEEPVVEVKKTTRKKTTTE